MPTVAHRKGDGLKDWRTDREDPTQKGQINNVRSIKIIEIYTSIFKNILTKKPMKNVKVAIPKLMIAISENLFQNEMPLATET